MSNDNNINELNPVSKSGNEIIGGIKTFSDETRLSRAVPYTDKVTYTSSWSPSLLEAAVVPGALSNKLLFYNTDKMRFLRSPETAGDNWEEITTYNQTHIKKLVGGDVHGFIQVANNSCARFAIELENDGNYVWLNNLFMSGTMTKNNATVEIWTKRTDGEWEVFAEATNPTKQNEFLLQICHPVIQFRNPETTALQCSKVRIVFTFTWGTGNVTFWKLMWYGTYPNMPIKEYATDELGNITFPGNVKSLGTVKSDTDLVTKKYLDDSQAPFTDKLTELQQQALTALRVHEGTGIKVQKETNGDITLSAEVSSDLFVVVQSLPASGQNNKIYLVPKYSPQNGNRLDEYIWVNGSWELMGSVNADMTNYYTKSETANQIKSQLATHNTDLNAHPSMKPESLLVTLSTDQWVTGNGYWTYRYALNDLKATSNLWMAPGMGFEDAYIDAGIYSSGKTENGFFEIYSRNKPVRDLTFSVTFIQ